jgi:3-hydroxyisobutyrate dehydrogenase
MIERVGVVGLGNMGSAMALCLQRAGFDTRSTSATAATRERAAGQGIVTVDSVAAVTDHAQAIVLALPTPQAVIEVVEGEGGVVSRARLGLLVVDTTTSDVPTTRRVAGALAREGARFIDAPVSGAPEVARKGQLTMMLGGDAADIEAATPVLEALSALRVNMGPLGSGQIVKLANNLMASAHLLVAGELVSFVRRAGLDVDAFLRAINASTGRSFITEVVYPKWIRPERHDLGFAVGLMRKDVRLAMEELERQDSLLPVARRVAEQWLSSGHLVGDHEDITRIVELPERRAKDAAPRE